MAFDINTAKLVEPQPAQRAAGGFDISTAKPIGDQDAITTSISDSGGLPASTIRIPDGTRASVDDSGALPVDSVQPRLTAAPAQAPVPQEQGIGQEILGGLDVAKTVLSSIVAEPIAGLAGLITSPFVGVAEATKNIEAVREFITLDPSTAEGGRNLKVVGDLVNKGVDLANIPISGLVGIGEVLTGQGLEQAAASVESVQEKGLSSTLGTRVLEETGSPELAAIAHSLPTAALELIGVKGLRGARLQGEKLSPNISKAITQAAPDLDVIKQQASDAYKELDNLGIKINPIAYERFSDKLQAKLVKEGLDPTLHPKSTAAMKRISDDIGQAKTPSEVETLRKIAKDAASSIDRPEARLGTIMVRAIDDALDSVSSQIGGKFKEARALSQRAFKSQAITDMIENASHTASGMENGLRIEARKLLKNKKRRRGFTTDELDALRKIEQGTTAANTAKFLGKFGISEGQATSMLGASIGIGGGGAIGSAFGGPLGAAVGGLAVPAIGQFAKKTAQRITLNNTKFADDLVRSGKNAKEITKAYLKHTPIASRRVSDLTDLLLDTELTPSAVRALSTSRSTGGKFIADAVHFANEVKRRAKQAGATALIAQPELDQKETK